MNCHELFVWQKCCFCNLDYGRSLKRFHVSWSCMISSNMKFSFFPFLNENNPNASTNIFLNNLSIILHMHNKFVHFHANTLYVEKTTFM